MIVNKKNDSLLIHKWIPAVINIETEPYSFQKELEISDLWIYKKISTEEYLKREDSIILERYFKRQNGTAVLLFYKNQYYLITARHVVDPFYKIADSNVIAQKIIFRRNIKDTAKVLGNPDSKNNFITNDSGYFSITVPIGSIYTWPYIFSSKLDDLALINLSKTSDGGDFIKTLLDYGHKPISINDLDTSRLLAKNIITTIGFPNLSFSLFLPNMPLGFVSWNSTVFSLPSVTKGNYIKDIPGTNLFYCNNFNYFGFSGGAVICNDKLVGIIHGFDFPSDNGHDPRNANYFNSYSIFIKIKGVFNLLNSLESKLNFADRMKPAL